MTKVTLGHHPIPYYTNGPMFLGSDSFYEPRRNVFGVATSFHHYHLALLSERDVQVAFDTVRAELMAPAYYKVDGVDLLQMTLQTIQSRFNEIDMHTHVSGIEFAPVDWSSLPKPAEDQESNPLVSIALLQLQKHRLSFACAGNFLVYLMRSTRVDLIFGWDWFSGSNTGGVDNFLGAPIVAHQSMPKVYSWEIDVEPLDLVIVTTYTLGETMALAELNQIANTPNCRPEVISRYLGAKLASMVPASLVDLEEPYATTKRIVRKWGAAWAIACTDS